MVYVCFAQWSACRPDALSVASVEVIPGQRVAQRGKVDPDLVGPPRYRDTGRQAEAILCF